MVDLLGVSLGLFLTLIVVAAHFAKGTTWRVPEDISQEVLERRAASVPETDFPEPMNRSVGGGGAVGAIAPGESEGELEDGEEADEGGPGAIPEDEIEHFEIEFEKEGETIEIANNETILDAGEDEGFDLPYACREGQCLSCSAHIPNGPSEDFVVHDNQEMLSGDELDEGYTLTCVAYPRSDFTIETRESP